MAEQVSFTLPSPYQAEMADIARRQRMAELMQQQAFQPAETFSYNGIQARTSPLTGIAKALQGYMAVKTQKDLANEQKALGERAQKESASDFATLFAHMQGQEAQPERAPITAIDDQGNFEPNRPAVPARARGMVDPSILAALRDPQAKQLAMSQLLAQMTPKAPISVKPGEILVNPQTLQPVYTAPKDEEFGTTPHYELNDKGVPQSVVYSKTGARKVIGDAVPQNTFNAMPLEGKARLYFDMYKNQTLSADQLANLTINNAQLGIAIQKLIDETGQGPVGGVPLPRQSQIPQALINMLQGNPPIAGQTMMNQPAAQPGAQPAAMPMGQPAAPVRAPVAQAPMPQAPAMQAPVMPAGTEQNIPAKLQRDILKSRLESESKKTTSMEGLGDALKQAEEILTSKKITPTQSGLGTAMDSAAAFFGNAPAGAAQADQLRAIAGIVTAKMPRMEGPQSDRDVALYREMAGDIGNSNLPVSRRVAALQTVRALNEKYIGKQTPKTGEISEDQKALEWAKSNPTDPRAKAIRTRLGQ
jgi:hypothetical protein